MYTTYRHTTILNEILTSSEVRQPSVREHLVTLDSLREAVEGARPVAVDARGPWPAHEAKLKLEAALHQTEKA